MGIDFKFAENSNLAILVTDTDIENGPHILYANEKLLNQTGYTLEELLGQPPSIFYGPKTDQEDTKEIREQLKRGKGFHGPRVCYNKDGSELVTSWKIEPIVIDGVTYICATQDDLSNGILDALNEVKILQKSILAKMPETKNVPNSRKSLSRSDPEGSDASYVGRHRKSNVG